MLQGILSTFIKDAVRADWRDKPTGALRSREITSPRLEIVSAGRGRS